jgi:hypothetical protein
VSVNDTSTEDEGATDVDATDGNGTGPIRRYDLQVHTDASPCSAASPATIAHAASEAGLDGIAITNHDTTEGVREVRHAVSGLDAGATSGIDVIADHPRLPPERGPHVGDKLLEGVRVHVLESRPEVGLGRDGLAVDGPGDGTVLGHGSLPPPVVEERASNPNGGL